MKVARSENASPDLRTLLLTTAISALTAGSSVTQGRLVIDGESHPFSFTGASVVHEEGDGSESWTTFVIGWHHPDGDSLVVMVYYESESDVGVTGRTPGLVASRLGGSHLELGDIARMIGSGQGTVSKEIVPRFGLQEAALYAGDRLWIADGEGTTGGSVAFSDVLAECENIDSEDFLAISTSTLVGCDLRRLSVDGSADLRRDYPAGDPERVINLPSLTLLGPIAAFRLPE